MYVGEGVTGRGGGGGAGVAEVCWNLDSTVNTPERVRIINYLSAPPSTSNSRVLEIIGHILNSFQHQFYSLLFTMWILLYSE